MPCSPTLCYASLGDALPFVNSCSEACYSEVFNNETNCDILISAIMCYEDNIEECNVSSDNQATFEQVMTAFEIMDCDSELAVEVNATESTTTNNFTDIEASTADGKIHSCTSFLLHSEFNYMSSCNFQENS